MKIIAESSITRTEWAIADGQRIVEHAFTAGLNPYFQTRREISHVVRLELPDAFFKHRWEHVHFYGAGCANIEKTKVMESSLVAQFKSPVTVMSDLMGAARGMLQREPGLVGIIGSGSNSCLYDGRDIVKNISPLGYILGDEGSNAYMGKKFIADYLKELVPADLAQAFDDKFQISTNVLLDEVYSNTLPSRELSKYAFFLGEHKEHPYVEALVRRAFRKFFERNVLAYNYQGPNVHFVGSTCVMFEDLLRQEAAKFNINIDAVERYSLPGLVKYHATE